MIDMSVTHTYDKNRAWSKPCRATAVISVAILAQWLKCHRTQGNAVPAPPIFSRRRSITSNFQRTQGTLRWTLWYANNRVSACCALDFCTVLPFLRLRVHVKDVNVNAWLPDNEVNLVVSGPATTNRGTRGPKPSIRGPQPPIWGQNLKLQFPDLWISTSTTACALPIIWNGPYAPLAIFLLFLSISPPLSPYVLCQNPASERLCASWKSGI